MKVLNRFSRGAALLVALPFAQSAYAEETAAAAAAEQKNVEEIVVTGSYIKGSAEDAALPIDVVTQAELREQGSPTLLEMVRDLSVTSGNLGEENQFQPGAGQGQGAVTTINLRGLGSARTLVLVNGRRHVTTQAAGVDISFMPQMAMDRTEILKDGAAALYGSDAIAGVVNLITRGDFEGLEVTGSNQWIEDSDGQQDFGAIFGIGNDTMHWMTAVEYDTRNELRVRDRDWALRPRPQNTAGGWSNIANPATIFPAVYSATPGGAFLGTGGIVAGSQGDTQCETVGGAFNGAGTPAAHTGCAFQYTFFDNIVNPQSTYKGFTEFNWDLNDHTALHLEALYSRINFSTNTSPSYAPQSLFGPDRWIAPTHPGLIDYKQQNPTANIATALGGNAGAYALARAFGNTGWFGHAQSGDGMTNTYRLGASLVGDAFEDAIHFDFAVNYSHRERVTETPDTVVERMAFSLDGLGGPGCTPGGSDPATSTPGNGICQYYNPFSNAIQRGVTNGGVNPQYNAAVANTNELAAWLIEWQHYNVVNELLVWDAVVSGETPITLPGGTVGWAFGVQARNEKYDVGLNQIANRQESPCAFNDPYSVTIGNVTQTDFDTCQAFGTGQQAVSTGLLGFLSAYDEESTKRTVYAAFSEFSLPITDTLDAQFAVRFEDYGDPVGNTIDPKLAMRWQALDWLALRGSISTTFRGPPQSYLGGRATTLQFIVPANAFKAVDIVGNEDLEPETAVAANVGIVIAAGGFTGSLDYWQYNFSDPFQTESTGQLLNRYSLPTATNPGGLGCQGPPGAAVAGPGYGTPDCLELSQHVFPLGTAPALLSRVDTYIINGSDIDTDGVDLIVQYAFDDVLGGQLTLGAEGSYMFEYSSDDFVDIGGVTLAPGGDMVGLYNTKTNPFLGLPEMKGNAFARYRYGDFTLSTTMRYIDGYTDEAPTGNAKLKDVDSMTTFDATAIYGWRDFIFSATVFNIADEEPPWVSNDLNYDPNNFSALGRMVKVQMTYTLGGG